MSTVELLERARAGLRDAPQEALGELIEPRRILGIARAPRIVSRGGVWHLGALLLADDVVYATGDIVRARAEARRGYPSESQRHRAALAAAAHRGGFAEGVTVHLGWRMLDPAAVDAGESSGPLSLRDGVPSIRWSTAGGDMPLERYLDERIGLLRDPPPGA